MLSHYLVAVYRVLSSALRTVDRQGWAMPSLIGVGLSFGFIAMDVSAGTMMIQLFYK